MRFCERPVLERRVSVPGCVVIGTRFDHRLLSPACIARSDIDLPPGIRRSAPRRQAEFLAGRLCTRKALEALTGTATVPLQGTDRSPQWPASVCGSITHNRHRALAMVALREDFRALGIDIETRLDEGQSHALAGEILARSEHERFLAMPKERRAWLLTLAFSLKESLYKALYPLTGTQFYFEHAELLDWSPDGHARLRLLCDLSDGFPANTEIAGRFCELGDDLLSYVAIPNRP
ncbi:4'-phosphopantetheinyl transferase family protein [Zestomonas carbonaria]|uniref:Enterobactin synthase component D n=1 Tax=Zestomonas carbonaria TaxID=2762745 RepID=A0A7U7EP27_9GAMM|nr:4'-phosphopantetheinyl transferase superfamily protein [Pseudomonas carbonaria]CAD5108466.1 hypothetical protein PSEWESI4_02752 [Pseudomonas carbonaria]